MSSRRYFGLGCTLMLACLAVLVSDVRAEPSAWLWGEKVVGTYDFSGDQIASGATLYWESRINAGMHVNSGTVPNATAWAGAPSGIDSWWGGPAPCAYFHWAGGTATYTAQGPLGEDQELSSGVDLAAPYVAAGADIGVTRAIDNPILDGDAVTRTVTYTLDIPAGNLSGNNYLEVSLVAPWNLPEGMGYTVDPSSYVLPLGFQVSNQEGVVCTDGSVPFASLSGTYEFSADVTFQRSGSLDQATYGNMYWKPPGEVRYGLWDQMAPTVSPSVSSDLGGGVVVGTSSSVPVLWNGSHSGNVKDMSLATILAAEDAPVEIESVFLTKEKRTILSGQTVYGFGCEIEGRNIVSGTVRTPNGQVYALGLEDGDEARFDFLAAAEANLAAMDFVNGDYLITLIDPNGGETELTVALGGDYPTEMPELDLMPRDTTETAPTLSWEAPPDEVDMVVIGLEGSESDYEGWLTEDLDTETSWMPDEDLDYGGYSAWVVFADGEWTDDDGIDYFAAHLTTTDSYLNVVPEPSSAVVLLAGAAVLCRRRKT